MTTPLLPKIGDPLTNVSTPRPVIDEAVLEQNISRVQAYMDHHGLHFRPHIKTHKLISLAHMQIDAGAKGINCQKVTEAEIFANAGFEDILISYNIIGAEKLGRLASLNEKISGLKVTADSEFVVSGLASRFSAHRPLTVLVECDTGGGRCGVQSPQSAIALALQISKQSGLRFGGLMTYPKPTSSGTVETFLAATINGLTKIGLECALVTNGGTPSLFDAHLVPSATEHRAGTYVYNDRAMVRAGHCSFEDCAMHILATVVSRPTPERAVIDAGSKTLTSDLLGFSDYGYFPDYPEARIVALSEEHGHLDLSGCDAKRPNIGEQVRIIPNHTCVVSNLFDDMVFHRNGYVTRIERVMARGLVW